MNTVSPDRALGFGSDPGIGTKDRRRRLVRIINLKLEAMGLPAAPFADDEPFVPYAQNLVANVRAKNRLLSDYRCPVDARIERFLNDHFADQKLDEPLRLPSMHFVLDHYGLARELSLPVNGNEYKNDLVESYRVANGVLNNPKADRRTTTGTFHVVEGGLPVPFGKLAVPRGAFVKMFRRAMESTPDLLQLPFTAENNGQQARTFISLMLHPLVVPEIPGYCNARRLEVRFFAPGSLVSNLDFVESIFGNAGDPFLEENDLAAKPELWSGHTGCVILAPQLVTMTKKELGLPHVKDATKRQRADGMCWEKEDELYNNGGAFKVTCRTNEGVIVTLIADNYYGYCKKEVKTQISYATNLLGNAEEEHAGGALVFPSYNLAEAYFSGVQTPKEQTMAEVRKLYADMMDLQPEGHGIDKKYPKLIYIPEDGRVSVRDQQITWTYEGAERSIPLLPEHVYMTPSGYKIRLQRHPEAPSWRVIGTVAEGTFCHKPCTVSGGGKSEISKSLRDFMIFGPIFVADFESDKKLIQEIFDKNYGSRWKDAGRAARPEPRSAISSKRSLGSLIKMLTPSPDFSDEYNQWLASIPNYIYALVFVIKTFYQESWGTTGWTEHFSVDSVNGFPGHELKYNNRKIVGSYLRVGFHGAHSWRTFKVRQDFIPSDKIQTEDDISVSTLAPISKLKYLNPVVSVGNPDSVKLLQNVEFRLFQRPDEAIHRGFDRQAEADLARSNNFISNFHPMPREEARMLVDRAVELDLFTPPMKKRVHEFATNGTDDGHTYVVSSAHPRLVNGKRSVNPRYLQDRPDMVDPFPMYVAYVGMRLHRRVPLDLPVLAPVNSVLMGRRNNPPDPATGMRALAVYNPIHYQPLPELFMDLIASLTGRSPSTTGAGSEGALTKGPFNALRPTADLNSELVSFILTDMSGFSTAAGCVGPNVRVDHDISLLIPEIWARMLCEERRPEYLIAEGLLEKLDDFEHNGELIHGSRLGYRVTRKFVRVFFGRVFDNPLKVFDKAMLQPETQNMDIFVDGIKNITEAQQRVAQGYFDDNMIEDACPPLQALLTIMATGSFEGKNEQHPDIRAQFTKESLLASDWYKQRLLMKQKVDAHYWRRQAEQACGDARAYAMKRVAQIETPEYLDSLQGTIGCDPSLYKNW